MKLRIYSFLVITLLLWQSLGATTTPALAAPPPQQTAALDTPFAVKIGEEPEVETPSGSLFIFFAAVLRDGRCPQDATCTKKGPALFQLIVSSQDRKKSEILTIGTGPDQNVVQFQGYTIELVEVLTPAPRPDENFILLEYHIVLQVQAAAEVEPPTDPETDQTPEAQAPNANLDPIVVDGCVNFTAFDAAAILQEPVKGDEPIGNLLFGPLPADLMAAEEPVLSGLCGYVSLAEGNLNREQTHIATRVTAQHAVVADRLVADPINANGALITDLLDLYALAEVVGAAHPEHDSEATFDLFYNYAGDFPMMEMLRADAEAARSFRITTIDLPGDDPHDEMIWLWQTLDEGYFSLLIASQGNAFDIVAARLGEHVNQQKVLGYSQVILDQLYTQPAVQERTGDNPTARFGCDRLQPADVATIVGEPVVGQAVANIQGEGCKYTPSADEQSIDPADFSLGFQNHGLLVGAVPPKAAQTLLSGMVDELANSGNVQDGETLGAILDAIKAANFAEALPLMAGLDWDSPRWQVEPLPDVSDAALLIHGDSSNGWTQFFLLTPGTEDGLSLMTGVIQPELDEVREAIIAVANQLADSAQTESDPQSIESANSSGCTVLTTESVEKVLGEAVRAQAVAGERGEGCKYTPASEGSWVEPDDFSPNFESHGLLVGVMAQENAQWFLGDLLAEAENEAEELADLQALVDEGEIKEALQLLPTSDIRIPDWQIETLTDLGDDALWLHGEIEGQAFSFFVRSHPAGGIFVIALASPEDAKLDLVLEVGLEGLAAMPDAAQ